MSLSQALTRFAVCTTVFASSVVGSSAFANGKPYKPVAGVSGSLKAIGSDSMNNEMSLWAEGFRKFYPGIKIEVEGKGSATAPPALIEGTAQLGPMSRPMKNEETNAFKKKYGFEPTAVKTSLDVLAVYIHRDNPLKGLTLEQVDAIFSKTRKGGAGKSIETWGDVGLTGEWQNKPIQMYGRNSASGTYGYFKEHALYKGDFKNTVKEQPGSAAVVQAVTNDKYAIGYSGIGYKTSGVKPLSIAEKKGQNTIEASEANVLAGTYPLGRFLLLYINKSPSAPLDPIRREFIKFVLSKEGQEAVKKEGYIPLPQKIIDEQTKKLALDAK